MEEKNNIDKKAISKALSEKLKMPVEITKLEKIGSGYHSDGFKATSWDGKEFFIKRFKSHDLGFVFPERKVFSLMLSQGMAKRSNKKPAPIGIMLANKNEASLLPEIDDDTEIYHVQEFEPKGQDYFSALAKSKEKAEISQSDIIEIKKVVEYISSIHAVKYPLKDSERMKEAYNDGIRSVINSPELAIMMLHDFDENHPILNRAEQKEYLGLMYDVMHKWKNRSDRLCALHGDFWGANFFFKPDYSTWVIDYSRIPWGDPGIDVGWWISQYLWFYTETGNSYFKELGEEFLKEYEGKTGDKEIRKAVSIVLGLMGLIFVFPRFYPDRDAVLGKKFIALITKILKTGELSWN